MVNHDTLPCFTWPPLKLHPCSSLEQELSSKSHCIHVSRVLRVCSLQNSLSSLTPSHPVFLSLKEERWRWNPLTFIAAVTLLLEIPRYDPCVQAGCCPGVFLGRPLSAFLPLPFDCPPKKQRRLNKALKWILECAHKKMKPVLCMLTAACESRICILPWRETGVFFRDSHWVRMRRGAVAPWSRADHWSNTCHQLSPPVVYAGSANTVSGTVSAPCHKQPDIWGGK